MTHLFGKFGWNNFYHPPYSQNQVLFIYMKTSKSDRLARFPGGTILCGKNLKAG